VALAACRLKLVFFILFILNVRSCELDRVLPLLIFKKFSGRMTLPSWAWYRNEYLDSFLSIRLALLHVVSFFVVNYLI